MVSNKQQINWKEVKESTRKLRNFIELLSECGFVLIVPPSLVHERRIKMKQNKDTIDCVEKHGVL